MGRATSSPRQVTIPREAPNGVEFREAYHGRGNRQSLLAAPRLPLLGFRNKSALA
jgi:hypothetical protein